MTDDDLRKIKADALRDAAEGFRRVSASGTEPELNDLLASLLEDRAARVASGENDHSGIRRDADEWPPGISETEGLDPRQP